MLDYDKTHDWIVQNIRSCQTAQEQKLTFRQTHELNGATHALSTLLHALEQGEFNADPTPIKDIKVRTQNLVRAKDLETSWDAAIQQTGWKRQELYIKIMSGLRGMGPATDEMLADYMKTAWPSYKFSPSGLRTRRSELVKAGWVEAAGKRKLRNGNQATVWATTN